ncbi:transferase [Streptomyces sp. NPDC058740]|uniref:transferase n=1 Tax=Streptomyces sp. NPDC058740 TaxID=3346619 RepID=UPI0036CBA0D1
MFPVHLGDHITSAVQGRLAGTPYGDLSKLDLADFLACWPELHSAALTELGAERVHPTAQIHPTAIIGDDVLIGPGAKIHEFTTVRHRSVIAAGASVGFNCEITHAFVGESAVLGHRIGVNRTLVGAGAHLSATVTVAAIHLCDDMTRPDREVIMRGTEGLYRCGTTQFGGVIGDGVQTGNNIALGPGIAIGRRTRINSGVTLAARIVPPDSIITAPHTADTTVRSRRGIKPGARS